MGYVESNTIYSGYNYGRAIVQDSGNIGGKKHVFVKLQGKATQLFPTIGGKITNPFKGRAKAFAGDLCELDPINATVKILKTYLLADAVSSAKTAYIVRDGFKHIPFVGDIVMVAASTAAGTGTGVTVSAVEATTLSGADVWKLTLSAAITAAKGDVLVEATETGASATAVVTAPNSFLECDVDFLFDPRTSDTDFDGAAYTITPQILGENAYIYTSKMSPMPASILALNKSKFNGWFKL